MAVIHVLSPFYCMYTPELWKFSALAIKDIFTEKMCRLLASLLYRRLEVNLIQKRSWRIGHVPIEIAILTKMVLRTLHVTAMIDEHNGNSLSKMLA